MDAADPGDGLPPARRLDSLHGPQTTAHTEPREARARPVRSSRGATRPRRRPARGRAPTWALRTPCGTGSGAVSSAYAGLRERRPALHLEFPMHAQAHRGFVLIDRSGWVRYTGVRGVSP